jgi:hypothetical protein
MSFLTLTRHDPQAVFAYRGVSQCRWRLWSLQQIPESDRLHLRSRA